jgi:hypothetical protein
VRHRHLAGAIGFGYFLCRSLWRAAISSIDLDDMRAGEFTEQAYSSRRSDLAALIARPAAGRDRAEPPLPGVGVRRRQRRRVQVCQPQRLRPPGRIRRPRLIGNMQAAKQSACLRPRRGTGPVELAGLLRPQYAALAEPVVERALPAIPPDVRLPHRAAACACACAEHGTCSDPSESNPAAHCSVRRTAPRRFCDEFYYGKMVPSNRFR